MKNRSILVLILVAAIFLFGVVVFFSISPFPVRLITEYPLHQLIEEGQTMHECAECHEGENFHSCESCHHGHGDVAFDGIKFSSTLQITGDVPNAQYVPLNQVFLKEGKNIDKRNVLDFLDEFGIHDFQEMVLYTNDTGFVSITRDNLGSYSYLMPYEDGIRFADENIHVSAWLKSIIKIIIIGKDHGFRVNGLPVSYGQALVENEVQFSVEEAPVMFTHPDTGEIRKAETASRLAGVELVSLIEEKDFQLLSIQLKNGETVVLDRGKVLDSKITLLEDQFVLVFPNQSRKQWIYDVQEITTERYDEK